jgi:aminobenzoyl-glutamate utilization protein B
VKLLTLFLLAAATLAAQTDDRSAMLSKMDTRAQHFGDVSRQVWEFAEVGYKEVRSSALLKAELQAAGFSVKDNVAEIPTAFSATWGSGKPVISILGEYDALPGLSQQAKPERQAITVGAPGHGCGHNLLGTAAAFAAIAVKDYLQEHKLSGTIQFFGTPAEEGGGGKVYMSRAGVFNDSDVVLAWHPGDRNQSSVRTSLANINAKFKFYGKPSHAAAAPEAGRSALDGLMVMTYAVEMMREHVPETTRIHYIITSGGAAPNVVPDFAEVYLYARHPDMPTLDGIWARILKTAQAGALATETRVEVDLVNSVYNLLPNRPLAEMFHRNQERVGGIKYTPEEQAFAETLAKTFDRGPDILPIGSQEKIQGIEDGHSSGSTDVGDVSWIVPTSEFNSATYVPGTAAHSWQSAACAGSSIGRKGMVTAAKVLALSAVDLFTDPTLVAAARADFEKRRAGYEYRSRVPADHKAPLNYRDKPTQ